MRSGRQRNAGNFGREFAELGKKLNAVFVREINVRQHHVKGLAARHVEGLTCRDRALRRIPRVNECLHRFIAQGLVVVEDQDALVGHDNSQE